MAILGILAALGAVGHFFGAVVALKLALALVALAIAGKALSNFPKQLIAAVAGAGALVVLRDWDLLLSGAATLFILFILTCDGDGSVVLIDAVPTGDPMFNIDGLPMHRATDAYGNLHGTTYNDP